MAELDRDNGRFWEQELRPYAARRLQRHGVPPGRLDADDVVQIVWLELHTAKEPIRWADRYAYTVARHTILCAAREGRRSNSPAPDEGTALDGLDAAVREQEWESPVERRVLQRETAREIAAAKRRLTSLQRGAVEGTVEQGLSRSEVAARLGVQAGTVSAHRARGLRKLHAQLLGLVLGWMFLLCVSATYLLTHPPVSQAGAVGGLLLLLIEGTRRAMRSLKRSHEPHPWVTVWALAVGFLGSVVVFAVLVVVSRSTDGTPGLDPASGDEPTLDRSDLAECLEEYPRCPGNEWWWSVESDDPLETTFVLDKADRSRALRGDLRLSLCRGDCVVRWSIAADSRQIASGTLTGDADTRIDSRNLTEFVPQDTPTLVLTARRTDSDTDSAILTWSHAGLE
ncbi:sigma-70 family RNA polymerase sigma factor [Streptomyces sp. NPDC051963]|uniref:sigma-70 family RNA polymerase sigma factor n=1 Tax=Streptomyces sp. NPDC051963 TaxID=3365678 RepID=UPI0037D7F5B5